MFGLTGFIFGIFVAIAVVGNMNYNDAQEYDAHKCEMVKSGAWPKSVLNGVECK